MLERLLDGLLECVAMVFVVVLAVLGTLALGL